MLHVGLFVFISGINMKNRKSTQTARKSTTYVPERLARMNPRVHTFHHLDAPNQAVVQSNSNHSTTGDDTKPDGSQKSPKNEEKDGGQSKWRSNSFTLCTINPTEWNLLSDIFIIEIKISEIKKSFVFIR